MRAWMDGMFPQTWVAHLIGSVIVSELPEDFRKFVENTCGGTDLVIPALPNQLFIRDSACWIYDGVMVKLMNSGAA